MNAFTLENPKVRVAIYFDKPEMLDEPLDLTVYFQSYSWFSDYCRENNVQIYIVRGDSYLGKMQFKRGWVFMNSEMHEIDEIIAVDVIYLKPVGQTPKFDQEDLVINNLAFDEFCGDKWRTFQLLGQYMANTYQINIENWKEIIEKIKTKKVVLKPVTGYGGGGIVICDKNECDFPAYNFTEPYLAQDFIDTSRGISGLTDRVHDLRVVIFNGEPKCAFLRMAQPGKLLSNIAQGASAKEVLLEEIPPKVLEIVKEADKNFTHYSPRVYTIDFMFEGDRPYIGELNRRPGFPHTTTTGRHFTDVFFENLLDIFLSTCAS